jgi:hypothetical protein
VPLNKPSTGTWERVKRSKREIQNVFMSYRIPFKGLVPGRKRPMARDKELIDTYTSEPSKKSCCSALKYCNNYLVATSFERKICTRS